MVGRERRDVKVAPGGNENDTKGSFDESDDDELNFDEDETAGSLLSSGNNASAGVQMMSEAIQSPDYNNTYETNLLGLKHAKK